MDRNRAAMRLVYKERKDGWGDLNLFGRDFKS